MKEPELVGWTSMAGGLLAVVLGGLWTLQGLDLVGGSVMSGVTVWAVIGPVVAVAGLALIVVGVRRRSRAKAAELKAASGQDRSAARPAT